MKSAFMLVAMLCSSCSTSAPTPATLVVAGGGMMQVAGAATGGAGGAGTAAESTKGGAASSGSAGAPDDYDDSGCEHPAVTKDCSDGWCNVPPGCFIMGSPEHEWGHPPQEKRVKVTLTRGFVIGQHEVTNEQWASFKLANPGRVIDSGPSAGIGDCSEPELLEAFLTS